MQRLSFSVCLLVWLFVLFEEGEVAMVEDGYEGMGRRMVSGYMI